MLIEQTNAFSMKKKIYDSLKGTGFFYSKISLWTLPRSDGNS